MMKKRTVIIVGTALLVLCACSLGLVELGRKDVEARTGGEATLSGVRVSRTHILWFQYDLHNVPELSTAFWRLSPWRYVDVEK